MGEVTEYECRQRAADHISLPRLQMRHDISNRLRGQPNICG